jgi:hypothetical protein
MFVSIKIFWLNKIKYDWFEIDIYYVNHMMSACQTKIRVDNYMYMFWLNLYIYILRLY